MTTERFLVTGGAGFIGSAFVRRAVRDGHAVLNLDKTYEQLVRPAFLPVSLVPRYVDQLSRAQQSIAGPADIEVIEISAGAIGKKRDAI